MLSSPVPSVDPEDSAAADGGGGGLLAGSGAGATQPPELAFDPDRDLARVAAGASNLLLLGSLFTLILGLFPLRWNDSQWQLNQIGNLAANGTWILVGVVLLHLAVRHQPSKGRWLLRLAFLRRLMLPLTLLFLLLVPLQLALTWQAIETSRSSGDRALRGTLARVEVLRLVIGRARNLQDLRLRVRTIPGAPPLPAEADTVPFPTLRRTLLGQLDALSGSVRDQIAVRQRGDGAGTLWRQSARNAVSNLLLAFGFASAGGGRRSSSPLIALLVSLPGRLRRLPRRIGGPPPHGAADGAAALEAGAGTGGHRRRRRRSGGREGQRPRPDAAPAPGGTAAGGFAERWQRWKRRLRDDP